MKEQLKHQSIEREHNIKCKCGKIVAKRHSDGKIYVWCKECRKEVELEVELYETKKKNKEIPPLFCRIRAKIGGGRSPSAIFAGCELGIYPSGKCLKCKYYSGIGSQLLKMSNWR